MIFIFMVVSPSRHTKDRHFHMPFEPQFPLGSSWDCFHMSKAVHLSNVIELCIAMQELELHTLYAYRRLILPFSRLMFFFLNTFSCFCCFYLIALHIHDESLDGSCHAGNADSSGSLPATEG